MLISPHEQERLLIHVAAGLARERRARGLRLNYPEAVALITSFLLEGAQGRAARRRADDRRRGPCSRRDDVMDGVPEMLTEVQVEATFPDGTKLVTVHEPIPLIPGEILCGDGPVVLNLGRPVVTLVVANTGDRPVQVGSHFHFAQANAALRFDRELAGAAGWTSRPAPRCGSSRASEREVALVPLAGRRVVPGLQIGGRRCGSRGAGGLLPRRRCPALTALPMRRAMLVSELSRERYALLYGPTAGDRIRLADTSLLIEVERDLCAGGDEAVFGGGQGHPRVDGAVGRQPRLGNARPGHHRAR